MFDVVMSCVGLLVCAPLLAVLAVLVRCSGPGPVLYRQARLGEGGRTYEVLKLRTMVDAAEESSGAAWATSDDPRVTRIGAFLRDSRLDEIPQFWNVLRGDMSLVGPRPERPEFLDHLRREVPFWTARHMVKPGLTGWAQLNIGYTSDAGGAAEKLSYDLYYLRHRSLWMDIVISLATIQFMASGVLSRAPRHAPWTLAEPAPAVQQQDASAVSSMAPGQSS
jgi:lipopolysaccharide/colanic/teichoic acid biosynthesis glycosyltransferase